MNDREDDGLAALWALAQFAYSSAIPLSIR